MRGPRRARRSEEGEDEVWKATRTAWRVTRTAWRATRTAWRDMRTAWRAMTHEERGEGVPWWDEEEINAWRAMRIMFPSLVGDEKHVTMLGGQWGREGRKDVGPMCDEAFLFFLLLLRWSFRILLQLFHLFYATFMHGFSESCFPEYYLVDVLTGVFTQKLSEFCFTEVFFKTRQFSQKPSEKITFFPSPYVWIEILLFLVWDEIYEVCSWILMQMVYAL